MRGARELEPGEFVSLTPDFDLKTTTCAMKVRETIEGSVARRFVTVDGGEPQVDDDAPSAKHDLTGDNTIEVSATAESDCSASLAAFGGPFANLPCAAHYVLSGELPEAAVVLAARAEVKRELEAARRVGPLVRGEVALIRFASPTQIHPLIAQQWRGRLRDKIVMAANTGYRPGWVHFAVRSGDDRDLVGFLAAHRPPGADEMYGSGHRRATGGALRPADWNTFIIGLGFGPEATVPDTAVPEIKG